MKGRILFTALFSLGTLFQTVKAQDVFLKGKFVEVGVHPTGSFGSLGNAPSGYHARGAGGKLGFVCDIDKDGWNNGTPDYVGDYFVPGTPEEGWGIQWQEDSANGRIRQFNNFGLMNSHQITKTSHQKVYRKSAQQSEWLGRATDGKRTANVFQTVTLDTFSTYFTITALIQNTGSDTLFDLKYFRNVDPDNEQPITGNYSTNNYIDFQPGVSGNTDKAVVVAEGAKYGVPCILGAVDSRAHVAIGGFSNRFIDELLDNNDNYSKTNPLYADRAISISFVLGDLPPGKCVKVNYYYALQPVAPEDVEFPIDTRFDISDDGFGTSQTFQGGNLCVKDTILQFAVMTEGSGSSFIDKVSWDIDNDGTYDIEGDTAEITFPGWKSHSFGQRIHFCDGSIQDSVYTFYIEPKPVIQFTASTTSNCFNEHEFSFENTSWYIKDSIQRFTWKFGNGDTLDIQKPDPLKYASYEAQKNITLLAVTTIGCIDSSVLTVDLYPNPELTMSINTPEQCLQDNAFTTSNTVQIETGTVETSISWGDGNINVDEINAEHQYAEFGDYQIILNSESDQGCLKSDTLDVRVNPMPTAVINVNDTGQCLRGNEFQFKDESSIAEGDLTSEWSLQNDVYTEDFSVQFDRSGGYAVTLNVRSDKGCGASASQRLRVYDMPYVDFKMDSDGQCLKENKFEMLGEVSAEGTTHTTSWFVEDILQGNSEDFTATFNEAGKYRVGLKAVTREGCEDYKEDTVEVYPQVGLALNTELDQQCLRGNSFVFENKTENLLGAVTYSWDFDEDNVSGLEQPEPVVYNEVGDKVIQLTSLTDKGCKDTLISNVTVHTQPVSSMNITAVDSCFKTNQFIIENTSISEDEYQIQWSLESNGVQRIATNPRLENQRFNSDAEVRLFVKTVHGCTDTVENEIKLYEHPQVEFEVIEPVCLKKEVEVNNLTQGEGMNLTYEWMDNTGQNNSEEQITGWVYQDPGSYTITLKAVNEYGCKDEKSKSFTVYPSSFINININDVEQCYRNNVFVLNAVNKNQNVPLRQLDWSWSDGVNQTGEQVEKSFTEAGEFQVTLFTENEQGCLDTLESAVKVLNPIETYSSSSVVCFPKPSEFNSNTKAVGDEVIRHVWEVDGKKMVGENVRIKLSSPGIFDYLYWVETKNGCRDSLHMVKGVKVNPKPRAEFTLDSFFSEGLNMYLALKNESSDDVTEWGYSMNDWEYSFDPNPQFLFADTGLLTMTLIAGNDYGCYDTFVKLMGPYFPLFYMHVPNAFTPNGDDLNEEFKPIITPYLMKYDFKILNRWGEKVFDTNDPEEGWDATFKGKPVQDGAYTYILRATDLMGDTYSDKGQLLILR